MNRNDELFTAEKIRSEYTEKKTDELDTLKKLDRKVKRPAEIFAYTFGVISAIVMGAGMSLTMTDIGSTLGIGNSFVLGIVIGVIGMLMVIVNYPIYRGILSARKKKYASLVVAASDKIINAGS